MTDSSTRAAGQTLDEMRSMAEGTLLERMQIELT
jgi:hypothetical protein